MYSVIEIPLGLEQAKGSPASPRDAWRLLPTWARQRAGDHCGLKIVDPARTGTPASASQTRPLLRHAKALESGQLATRRSRGLESRTGLIHALRLPQL